MVEKAKDYIKEGDIFQVVLSNRLEAEMEDVYKRQAKGRSVFSRKGKRARGKKKGKEKKKLAVSVVSLSLIHI